MTKAEFLDTLRRRLAGLPPEEVDDLVGDYATHPTPAMAGSNATSVVAGYGFVCVRLADRLGQYRHIDGRRRRSVRPDGQLAQADLGQLKHGCYLSQDRD